VIARKLVSRGVAALLVVAAGCAPYKATADPPGQDASANPVDPSERTAPARGADTRIDFVRRVVGSTEDAWTGLLKSMGSHYEPPKIVVFRNATRSACGIMDTDAGSFYCPFDRKVYLEAAFLSRVPGDFAQAYLIVHEISHHVQNALGTMQQFESVLSVREKAAKGQRSELKVRYELQADCYTGVWAFYIQKLNVLDPGDLEEVSVAQRLGDATTHGTVAQRLWWFKHGLATGDPQQCDTFKVTQP